MSTADRDLNIQSFSANAQRGYDLGAMLRGTVVEEHLTNSESHRFPIFGVGDAIRRGHAADVTPIDVSNKKPTAFLEDWEFPTYVDPRDMEKSNVDNMRNKGLIGGDAVARQYDAEVIRVCQNYDGNAYSRDGLTKALVVDGGPTVLNAAAIAKMVTIIYRQMGMIMGTLTLMVPASQFGNMADDEKLASGDYLQQALGRANVTAAGQFGGMIFGTQLRFISDDATRDGHGRLPSNECYLYHDKAIGMALGPFKKKVEWSTDKQAYLCYTGGSFGAVRINNGGIVKHSLSGAIAPEA